MGKLYELYLNKAITKKKKVFGLECNSQTMKKKKKIGWGRFLKATVCDRVGAHKLLSH